MLAILERPSKNVVEDNIDDPEDFFERLTPSHRWIPTLRHRCSDPGL